jgi:anti-anti-sigma factor
MEAIDMTAVLSPQKTASPYHLTFATEWLDPSVVRISVAGDIDAANAGEVPDYVFGRAANCRQLILDMSEVTFFGTAGFSAVCIVDARCAQASVEWTLTASRAVSRVLDICDPRHQLPVVTA